jgi:hypothetical protein
MLTWLVESATLFYIVLGTLGLILFVAWWRIRKKGLAIGAGVVVALIAGVFILGYLVETDSQRIENSVREMASGLKAHDVDRIFAQISDRIHFQSTNGKVQFRDKVTGTMRDRNVTDAQVWGFTSLEEPSREKGTAQIEFFVKVQGNWAEQDVPYRCRADFVLDPDGKWRLMTFRVFRAVGAEPIQVPAY